MGPSPTTWCFREKIEISKSVCISGEDCTADQKSSLPSRQSVSSNDFAFPPTETTSPFLRVTSPLPVWLSHVSWFGRYNISKYNARRGLKKTCTWGLFHLMLLGIYPRNLKTYVQTNTCTQRQTPALFIIVKTRKQWRCPVGKGINKLIHLIRE